MMAGRKRPSSASTSAVTVSKHRVGYNASWTTDYPWHLPVYDVDGSEGEGTVIGVLCSLCKQHNTKQRNNAGTWTEKPCALLRRDMLQRHKESKMHQEAEMIEAARLESQRDGGIRQAFSARVIVQRKALIGALKLMYWLAKEEVAHTTKFNSLKDLVILLDCDYLRELCLGKNAQYTSEQIISEFLQCLGLVIEEKIILEMQSSDFFALMTGESTDIAVLKQLVLVGRYLTDSGVATTFLHIGDLANGTADTIERAMLQYISDKTLQVTKLCAFGSDGASVMTGRLTGVATRLKSHNPKMISVHCVNHRLALAASQASESIPYLKQFKSILQTLFYFYQNSAVRMASLHAIQEVLNDPVIKCKQAKDVRWLSHDNAIKAVIRTLPSLLVSLSREASENGEPTAHGLYKFMKSYKFIACAYLLSDILPHLSHLSRIFQKENVDLSLIQPYLKSTIDAISKYKHTDGPNLGKVDYVLANFVIAPTSAEKQAFKSRIQVIYVQAIIDKLNDRFPHVELIHAFSLFDPHALPSDEEDLTSYGEDKLDVLLSTFGDGPNPTVDCDECMSEWECLRSLIHNQYSSMTMRQMLRLLCTDKTLRDMFPQLTKLCTIAALIPVSTAECERAFSAMNRIKTDLRNRLKTPTLDCLMRISIEGPSVSDFNFERAADLWGGMRNRRLSIGSSSSSSSS